MSFALALDAYCRQLGLTNAEIAEACDVAAATLSRYRRGMRAPEAGSETVGRLANGIARLAREDGIDLQAADVRTKLERALSSEDMAGMSFHMRLDALMHLAGTRNADIAEATGVDPSYVSRIRRGQRTPANLPAFAEPSAHILARQLVDQDMIEELGELVGIPDLADEHPGWDAADEFNIAEVIEVWLLGSQIVQADSERLDRFFAWLDGADFSSWADLTPPDLPPASTSAPAVANRQDQPPAHSPFARFYYGLGGMRAAELAFLNMAADTRARTMSLSSDMPLLQLALDSKFIREYKAALERNVRAGCRLDVFYNLERPLHETIRSLRLWMPLYVTGLVTPYYLRGVNNRLFCHVNYVCDTCALSSEAVMGHQEDGRYYFTARPEDVSYYQRKAGFILEKASPLIDVYRDRDAGQAELFNAEEEARRARGNGHPVGTGRYKNVRVTSYPGDCTVLSLPCGESDIHFVVRHPKVNYVVARMK